MGFETQMEDIQDNVKALSAERDRFKTLLKQVSFRNSITPAGKNLSYTFEDQTIFVGLGSRGPEAGPKHWSVGWPLQTEGGN